MRWRPFAGLAFAAAAVAVAVVLVLGGGPTLEVEGQLMASTGNAGRLEVEKLGSGREVRIDSDALEILPKGEFYEVWFVGPGDSPSNPNRVSAGTFHPDEQGETHVAMHAAIDPAKFPRAEITAEPGDGDPAVGGPVVATLDS